MATCDAGQENGQEGGLRPYTSRHPIPRPRTMPVSDRSAADIRWPRPAECLCDEGVRPCPRSLPTTRRMQRAGRGPKARALVPSPQSAHRTSPRWCRRANWRWGDRGPAVDRRRFLGQVHEGAPDQPASRADQRALARRCATQRHGRRTRSHPACHRSGRDVRLQLRRPRPGDVLVPSARRRAARHRSLLAPDRRRPG